MSDMTAALAAIKARADKATPGPWDAESHMHMEAHCRCMGCNYGTGWEIYGPEIVQCRAHPEAVDNDARAEAKGRAPTSCSEEVLSRFADAEFIASARQDVPALVAYIKAWLAHEVFIVSDEGVCHCTCAQQSPDAIAHQYHRLAAQWAAFVAAGGQAT